MPNELLLELLEAGAHFGHQTQRWNPKMKKFIFGERNGIYIINLEKTADLLEKACEAVKVLASKGKNVVLVGTKKQAVDIVREEAERAGCYYINRRWLGGTLTNFETIRARINKLRELEELQTSGYLDDKAIVDATTKEEIDGYVVCVDYENNQFVYEYVGEGECNE